jgi:hypothetical protein
VAPGPQRSQFGQRLSRATDLERLAELLACAARTCPGQETAHSAQSAPKAARRKPCASNTGHPWTDELHEELKRRFREGADVEELAAEFGRGVGSIRWKLWELKVGEFPRDLVLRRARPLLSRLPQSVDRERETPRALQHHDQTVRIRFSTRGDGI